MLVPDRFRFGPFQLRFWTKGPRPLRKKQFQTDLTPIECLYVCARYLLFKYTLPDVVNQTETIRQHGNVASLLCVVCQKCELALLPKVTLPP